MTWKKSRLGLALLLLSGMIFSTLGASAQEGKPILPGQEEVVTLPGNPYQPWRDAGGRWVAGLPAGGAESALAQRTASEGGPDDYGYLWNDAEPLGWIDASGGVDLGLSPQASQSGPVDIGFGFKFYENIYTQLVVSLNGVVGFNSNEQLGDNPLALPDGVAPNNLIAPYWAPVDAVGGYIRYLRGGDAPQRWFAVEWNRVQADTWSQTEMDEFTFEVVLHENGDIVFQYGAMRIGGTDYLCQISGIEDSAGLDGLEVTRFCQAIAPDHAVRIVRPAPAARVTILSRDMGRLVGAGELAQFTFQARNTGELGTDRYEVYAVLSNSAWGVEIYHGDGRTPLSDSNGNANLDTGPLAQGETAAFVVAIRVGNPVNVGDAARVQLRLVSSLDPAQSRELTLLTAIPTNFAQAYYRAGDGAQRVYLARPDLQIVKRSSALGTEGRNGGILETPGRDLWAIWENSRCLPPACQASVGELEYAVLNHAGNFTRLPGKLTDHSGAVSAVYDLSASSAAAPNGAVGVFWRRLSYNENGEMNTNLYFAVLDSAGNMTVPPLNITNDANWGSAGGYSQPRLAATGDNRFVMTWYSYAYAAGAVRDIYYAIRDWQGNPIAAGKLTADTPGNDLDYFAPAVSALDNNRALLAFSQYANGSYALAYTVLDSGGNLVKPTTTIPGFSFGIDAIQLTGERIILAWTNYDADSPQVRYALLNAPAYDLVFGPVPLDNPAALHGDENVSVTRDALGRAALTWTDFNNSGYPENLFYALIAPDGEVITPPMIFLEGEATEAGARRIATSYEGMGNTTYTLAPAAEQVDAYIEAPALIGALPAGQANIPIQFGNRGRAPASEWVVTAILDSNLGYLGDTLGIAPEIVGNTLTWRIPGELAYLGYGVFNLRLAAPEAEIGTRYAVMLRVAAAGQEDVPANNETEVEVMLAHQIVLPAVLTTP